MRVAVTGATGLLGRHVVAGLGRSGISVVAGCRDLASSSVLREHLERSYGIGAKWVRFRLQSPDDFHALCAGCDGLVHTAYEHVPGRYRGGEGSNPEAYWKANLIGTLQLLEVARSEGVSRSVLMSSRAVFDGLGSSPSEGIPDDHEIAPTTRYGELKAMTELLVRSRQDMGAVALRATGIYGATWPNEDSKWWPIVVAALEGDKSFTCSNLPKTEVWVEDVVAAIQLLLLMPTERVSGNVFNCSDIAVSTECTFTLLKRFLNGDVPASREVSMLTRAAKPVRELNSQALRGLGWRPGGVKAYLKALQTLAEQARTTQSDPKAPPSP